MELFNIGADLYDSFSPDCCRSMVKPGVPPNAGLFFFVRVIRRTGTLFETARNLTDDKSDPKT
jgi:N-methylhydantoinase B/oxoprolinase/acetone carboxylase alpha subunit